MRKQAFVKLVLMLFALSGAAQDTLLTVSYTGKLDSIQSLVLNQKRYVQVFLPPGYKADIKEKYDVLYVTDGGNWNMNVVTQMQRFIQNEGQMPPSILVSIMGIDRNIELTPTVLKSWNKPTGGGDKFLAFIKDELIPYIDKTYPSNGENSIWGHSLGGMFVTYAMLREPTLFKSVIAADPSLWWDDGYVLKMAAEKLATIKDSAVTYFMSGREGPPFHEMRIDTMELLLKKYAPGRLKWKLAKYASETHSSLRLKTTYEGLKFAYQGMRSTIEFNPMNGILSTGKPYKIAYTDDTTNIHYTLDGTMPTESSPLAAREITVNGPATVKYRSISHRERFSRSVEGHFTVENLPEPIHKLKNALPGGFRYSYFEGEGDKRPDLKTAKPILSGLYNKDFHADSLPRKNNYALLLNGFLEAKTEGYYVFFVRAGKGSAVWVDGRQIMHFDDNDKHEYFSYMLPLAKGFHPVRIESFDKKADFNLLLYYTTPEMSVSGDPLPIPFELEYSSRP